MKKQCSRQMFGQVESWLCLRPTRQAINERPHARMQTSSSSGVPSPHRSSTHSRTGTKPIRLTVSDASLRSEAMAAQHHALLHIVSSTVGACSLSRPQSRCTKESEVSCDVRDLTTVHQVKTPQHDVHLCYTHS